MSGLGGGYRWGIGSLCGAEITSDAANDGVVNGNGALATTGKGLADAVTSATKSSTSSASSGPTSHGGISSALSSGNLGIDGVFWWL